MQRTYKLRKAMRGDKVLSYSLAVPPKIGRAIPEHIEFAVELTEDGLIYRPVREEGEDAERQ